jgi:hypothetical protein
MSLLEAIAEENENRAPYDRVLVAQAIVAFSVRWRPEDALETLERKHRRSGQIAYNAEMFWRYWAAVRASRPLGNSHDAQTEMMGGYPFLRACYDFAESVAGNVHKAIEDNDQ